MKASSAKGKGRRLQNYLKDKLYECFPSLRDGDIKGAVMGESGEDIKLSPAAQDLIPYSFECKNQERLNIWESLSQAEGNSNDRTPVVVFKRNRTKTYVAIDLEAFLILIGENNGTRRKGKDTRSSSK
tara:strand:- start:172 stop:555 length:384 start_codon:yes stop_codon:yes gene_type:complete